jgi:hypothetical protein
MAAHSGKRNSLREPTSPAKREKSCSVLVRFAMCVFEKNGLEKSTRQRA